MEGMDSSYIPPGYLTTRQAAQALGTSVGAIRNLVYRGRLTRSGGTQRHPWYAARDVAAIAVNRRVRQSA